MTDKRTYWAAELDQKKLVARALERMAWHLGLMQDVGRLQKGARLLSAYYGYGVNGRSDSSAQEDSDDGAVTKTHVNNIYPIIRKVFSLVFGRRPAVKPVATNGDAASAAQTRLAMGLHEFYERKPGNKSMVADAVLNGYLASSWWLMHAWKPSAGAEVGYDAETESLIYEGDVESFLVPPWRCAVDMTPSDISGQRWVLFRRRVSRHALVATVRDPETKEKLLQGAVTSEQMGNNGILSPKGLTGVASRLFGEDIRSEDEVWQWELRHLPCPELPAGRLVKFVEPHLILFDSFDAEVGDTTKAVKYPYEADLQAFEYSPENLAGTTHGHTPGFDLMGLQEFHDVCTTSMSTTVDRLGLPHLSSTGASGAPTPHALSAGITVLEQAGPDAKLTLIDFPALKGEVQAAADWAITQMRQQMALNETVMGAPPAGMPASAQALQRAQAVEVSQGPQDRALTFVERVATGRLRLLKRFARSQRVAEIAGVAKSWEVVQWKAEDIAGVERFECEPIDPMSSTFEGRMSTAEQMGITGPELIDFMQTGNLAKVLEPKTSAAELVEKNCALLRKGVGLPPVDMAASQAAQAPVFASVPGDFVRVLKSDPHDIAIKAYKVVLDSPETRADPKLTTAVTDVLTESERLYVTLTPDQCFMYGIAPLPSMLAPPPPPGMGPPPPDAGGAPSGPPGAEGIALPKPPMDPITGGESPPLQGIQ